MIGNGIVNRIYIPMVAAVVAVLACVTLPRAEHKLSHGVSQEATSPQKFAKKRQEEVKIRLTPDVENIDYRPALNELCIILGIEECNSGFDLRAQVILAVSDLASNIRKNCPLRVDGPGGIVDFSCVVNYNKSLDVLIILYRYHEESTNASSREIAIYSLNILANEVLYVSRPKAPEFQVVTDLYCVSRSWDNRGAFYTAFVDLFSGDSAVVYQDLNSEACL